MRALNGENILPFDTSSAMIVLQLTLTPCRKKVYFKNKSDINSIIILLWSRSDTFMTF
jgi:hypothetical protein